MINEDEILIVIVLYKNDDEVFYLKKYNDIDILIYDNSKKSCEIKSEANFKYIHDSRNLGVCTAYNYAYLFAKAKSKKYLLLLDDDTLLTDEYIKILLACNLEHNIVCVVPKILDVNSDKIISPLKINKFGFTTNTASGYQYNSKLSIINSCSLISLTFLENINGFNTKFKLDFLDHDIQRKIYQKKKGVLVIDYIIKHSLSVHNLTNIKTARYMSIIKSEYQYIRGESFIIKFFYIFKFLKRIGILIYIFSNNKFK